MRDPFCVGGERRRKNEYLSPRRIGPPEQRPRCRDFPSEAEEGLAPRAESELRCGAEVRGPSNGGRLVGDKKRNEVRLLSVFSILFPPLVDLFVDRTLGCLRFVVPALDSIDY